MQKSQMIKILLNIEQFIMIKDILLLIFKNLLNLFKIKNLKKVNIDFEDLHLRDEINYHYLGSYINRSKLEIYSKAIPRFLKKF